MHFPLLPITDVFPIATLLSNHSTIQHRIASTCMALIPKRKNFALASITEGGPDRFQQTPLSD